MNKKCENCKKEIVDSKERDVCGHCINKVLIQGGRKELVR